MINTLASSRFKIEVKIQIIIFYKPLSSLSLVFLYISPQSAAFDEIHHVERNE